MRRTFRFHRTYLPLWSNRVCPIDVVFCPWSTEITKENDTKRKNENHHASASEIDQSEGEVIADIYWRLIEEIAFGIEESKQRLNGIDGEEIIFAFENTLSEPRKNDEHYGHRIVRSLKDVRFVRVFFHRWEKTDVLYMMHDGEWDLSYSLIKSWASSNINIRLKQSTYNMIGEWFVMNGLNEWFTIVVMISSVFESICW